MIIPLTNSVLFAEIDDSDYFATFKVDHSKSGTSIEVRPCDVDWFIHKNGYVVAKKQANYIQYLFKMHRIILGHKAGYVIDHKSQNKLDNKRSNLHFVTYSNNAYNKKSRTGTTSTFKGVCRDRNKYKAQIQVQGSNRHLGTFTNEVDAALAYDAALRQIYPNAPAAAFNF